ncbi:CDP-glucose 4,6-dehydratase [Paenibacillus motobuensis]|uniref:CDP-glucose 4,6-dehydratase n=1 Tax=Paenibacillus TaxID=44249 RepID=UPI00203AA88E|nr:MULTISPECIES: CDP-glucose 4,6-dehydratase [Paenibacillus]MCM3040839.1 CDP-glucose 4,6-dehydratase [Paenibacillus lutimineralis]MCM3647943.1 CDP-glucose 4,6-dehydratase [Paenibacillus motobuensis]
MLNRKFWRDKRVFLTGHTGFKGSWLSLWLTQLGAKVTGFSLSPSTEPNLFEVCNIESCLEKSIIGDIRNFELLETSMREAKPQIVIHMAAQPLVSESYINPVETYAINVMGTANLLETIRRVNSENEIKAVVNVTTDKCYENKEWFWGYRENEPLGGYDPYSSSKACSELVTASYRNSFFNPDKYSDHGVAIATARAGNVIGGGDWSQNRLVPDIVRSIIENDPIIVRNPDSIRPWQHVLEPLSGYLLLAEKLYLYGCDYAEAWNFGPNDDDAKTVQWIVERFCSKWDVNQNYQIESNNSFHEAHYLKLDCSKARYKLQWAPKWSLDQSIEKIIEWNSAYMNKENMREICVKQILEYSKGF